ncbi:280_t:CDS:1, partial [Acaulospora colombiana]
MKCGIKTSHALARGGLGDALLELYVNTPASRLPIALSDWRGSLRRYLATDPDKYIGRKEKKLAQSIPDSFPPLDVLDAYVRPVTSELEGIVPEFTWSRQPSLKDITNQCEMHYEWGVKPLILKRFRTVIWKGALMRVLRAAVMEGDEKEMRKAKRMGNPMATPMSGRRAAAMAVGTPSRLITQCLSGLQLQTPNPGATARNDDPFSSDYPSVNRPDEDDALLVKIHSQRTHTSTDRILEYRLEINPTQFVRLVEQGFMGLRPEDEIDVENFGKRRSVIIGGRESDDDEEFGDVDEGDEEGGRGKGKKKKAPMSHTDPMRIWVPA